MDNIFFMKATTLPLQSEIENFLGQEFFPYYSKPMVLPEVVDMVQLQFQVTDEDRSRPVPRGHACGIQGGSILECLTHFALLRLEERGYIRKIGRNQVQWNGLRFAGKVSKKDVSEARLSLKILTAAGTLEPAQAINLVAQKWPTETVQRAAKLLWNRS